MIILSIETVCIDFFLNFVSFLCGQELFVHNGGILKDNQKVTGIIPGEVVTLQTDKSIFRAKKVILATGSWTNEVLKCTDLQLPIKVHIL